MKTDVIKLDAGKAGEIDLNDAIFGLEPRADILHRVVRWQRAKAQAGTHSTLGRSDVSYSTKKIYRQKGTGGARHGSRKAPIFRKGGIYKGPVSRSHEFDLPKKVRALGLKHALSAKAKAPSRVRATPVTEWPMLVTISTISIAMIASSSITITLPVTDASISRLAVAISCATSSVSVCMMAAISSWSNPSIACSNRASREFGVSAAIWAMAPAVIRSSASAVGAPALAQTR